MKHAILLIILLTGCSGRYQINKTIDGTERALKHHIGFYLTDLTSQKPLIDYNGSKYFTPASNTKILTFYTALRLLGDSAAAIKYMESGDSLFFEGLGDPSFLYKNVFDNGKVYRFLRDHPGQLFFSSANFQTEALGPGWAWDDYNSYYSAERSALPIYGNLISIKYSGNGNFIVQPSRFLSSFHLSNEIHSQEEIIRDTRSNELMHFAGKKKSNTFAIPFQASNHLITDLLGDTLHRSVKEMTRIISKNAAVLKSIPIDSLYRVMLQDSDNFIAEQLLLQCAAMVSDTLKPEIAIRYSIKNFLSDLPDAPQWVDGSGLSRYNLFTPRSLAELWKKIEQTVQRERLFSLLAVGGKSGTLKNWYKADQPYIFGKTGSLSNHHSLSGFIITRKKKILIFSLMNDNFTESSVDLRKRMEKILKQVHDKF